MSTSKHIDRICVIAVVVALLMGVLFMNGAALGVQVQAKTMGYENRLFDTSKVHTIDIVMDDWDEFLTTAQSEEYAACNVVIDGEVFANVGIRGKGNTSLSTVSSMDSDRYSFKIEFDQYDSANSYYGLDKLSLNNLIQDNTMMKDYLTYQMMNEFGAAAPLCSYAYITVNGEDWGLYLAVEAVEESFLQRNYGSGYGELYKPDSMDMGGGRGNGRNFNFEDFMGASDDESATTPSAPVERTQGGRVMPGNAAEQPAMPEGVDPSQMGGIPDDFGGTEQAPEMPEDFDFSAIEQAMPGGVGMGSSDTKLQYIDAEPSSYSTIFDNAKTDITAADQQRLIESLKILSGGEDVASVVAVEDVIRYFVVHNYVVNGDSYTGSMIHNYYLYEEDGQLSMIPWDYNLAFGTFQGSDAAQAVSDDIDSPLSVTGSDRPMIDWIFNSEEYTQLYHTYFREFLDTVDAQDIIAQAKMLIAPYVEKDPTKFCTYEEFEKGVETLSAFCELRNQSVAAQLDGGDGTVDTSSITLSDMGTMNNGFGGSGQMPGSSIDTDAQTSAAPEKTTGGSRQFPGAVEQGSMELPEGMENIQPGQNRGTQADFPNHGQTDTGTVQGGSQWIILCVTAVILGAGLLLAFKFKR